MTHEVNAWAVVENENILINTVSKDRITAIINWLVTERCMMVYNSDSIEKIEASWQSMRLNASCFEVRIIAP